MQKRRENEEGLSKTKRRKNVTSSNASTPTTQPSASVDIQGIYLPPPVRKRLIHRLRRMRGQIQALERQIDKGRCADDLLVQIAAVRGALNQFTIKIMEKYLVDCAVTCMAAGSNDNKEVLQRITRALSFVLKQSA